MADYHGKFVWYELMTTDAEAATAFYRAAVGWGADVMGPPGQTYTILKAADRGVAGVSAQLAAGAKPSWIGYVAVGDVDAEAKRVTAAGGSIHFGPADIPGVGRFCMVADPFGAVFNLFDPIPPAEGVPPPPPEGTPGYFGWRELFSTDGTKAFDFYAGVVGWTKGEAFDMGAMGTYQLYACHGETLGGMMTSPPGSPPPFWLYYAQVDSIDAAIARMKPLGGVVTMGPHQVPTGQWIVQATDPQGAMFALLSDKP